MTYTNPHFEIIKETPIGRLGRISCAHGVVETPAFIFCATKGAIKGATPAMMLNNHTQALLANTFNLMDFPGGDFLEKAGGLHKLMDWKGPMWTDSGGFQVFSLGYGSVSDEIKGKRSSKGFKLKIDEDGIIFKSPRDGRFIPLTPELSMRMQKQIGADFIFVLDECTPYHMTKEQVETAMNRSHRWEKRSFDEHKKLGSNQGLYGIVQGGVYEDLRIESIDFVNSLPFFGHGIGGSLGANHQHMRQILQLCNDRLAPERPKHLLGIGKIADIELAVPYNIDTFDCVHPTRIARHGGGLVNKSTIYDDKSEQNLSRSTPFEESHSAEKQIREHISLKNAQYKYDYRPIQENCNCYTCMNFTRSYINYLFAAKEILGILLLVEHNVHFMNKLMQDIRQRIKEF